MATVVVMYTLRRSGNKLLGPINRWIYASFAPKRHVFEIARREANKRGFTEDSGRLIQIVTDGDDDLATYAAECFPLPFTPSTSCTSSRSSTRPPPASTGKETTHCTSGRRSRRTGSARATWMVFSTSFNDVST
jgi:hypothetical protein